MDATSWRDVTLGRPCWYCTWWGGMLNTANSRCLRDRLHIVGQPAQGCAFYEREPGGDDDDWSPMKKPGDRPG